MHTFYQVFQVVGLKHSFFKTWGNWRPLLSIASWSFTMRLASLCVHTVRGSSSRELTLVFDDVGQLAGHINFCTPTLYTSSHDRALSFSYACGDQIVSALLSQYRLSSKWMVQTWKLQPNCWSFKGLWGIILSSWFNLAHWGPKRQISPCCQQGIDVRW